METDKATMHINKMLNNIKTELNEIQKYYSANKELIIRQREVIEKDRHVVRLTTEKMCYMVDKKYGIEYSEDEEEE